MPEPRFSLDAEPHLRAARDYVELIASRLEQAGHLDDIEHRSLCRIAIDARSHLAALEADYDAAGAATR